jgi:signal peptidase II
MSAIKRSVWGYAFLFFGIVLLDRISKWYAMQQWHVPLQINQFLTFELAYNRGISWGMFHSTSNLVFACVSIAIGAVTLLVASSAWIRFMNGHSIIGELLVVAGSVSNLIDRALYGGVVDFILLSYGEWSWPVFNLADMAIVLGVGVMILEHYRS